MTQITKEHLEFVQEAKGAFSKSSVLETYFSKDDYDLIALRFGVDRDCVMVYELGFDIANFTEQMDPKPNPRKEIMNFAHEMETALRHYPALENKEQAYVYGSLQNIMNSLFVNLREPYRPSAKSTKNMCVNLAAQAMLLAKVVERMERYES